MKFIYVCIGFVFWGMYSTTAFGNTFCSTDMDLAAMKRCKKHLRTKTPVKTFDYKATFWGSEEFSTCYVTSNLSEMGGRWLSHRGSLAILGKMYVYEHEDGDNIFVLDVKPFEKDLSSNRYVPLQQSENTHRKEMGLAPKPISKMFTAHYDFPVYLGYVDRYDEVSIYSSLKGQAQVKMTFAADGGSGQRVNISEKGSKPCVEIYDIQLTQIK